MKQTLKAGATLDLLSGDEYRQGTAALARDLRPPRPPSRDWQPCQIVKTDSAGNLGGGYTGPGARLYQCPVGFFADLHRLVSEIDGFPDPSAPLTTGSWKIFHGSATPLSSMGWFAPNNGGSVSPVTFVEGEGCPVLRPGDQLVVAGAGLPVNAAFFAVVLVRLWPTGSGPTRTVVQEG